MIGIFKGWIRTIAEQAYITGIYYMKKQGRIQGVGDTGGRLPLFGQRIWQKYRYMARNKIIQINFDNDYPLALMKIDSLVYLYIFDVEQI